MNFEYFDATTHYAFLFWDTHSSKLKNKQYLHIQVYEIMTRSDYKTISKAFQSSVVLTLPNSVDSNFGLTVQI